MKRFISIILAITILLSVNVCCMAASDVLISDLLEIDDLSEYSLVLHCGGCMITENEVMSRMKKAQMQNIPFTNYGILIAYMNGILKKSIEVFPEIHNMI